MSVSVYDHFTKKKIESNGILNFGSQTTLQYLSPYAKETLAEYFMFHKQQFQGKEINYYHIHILNDGKMKYEN